MLRNFVVGEKLLNCLSFQPQPARGRLSALPMVAMNNLLQAGQRPWDVLKSEPGDAAQPEPGDAAQHESVDAAQHESVDAAQHESVDAAQPEQGGFSQDSPYVSHISTGSTNTSRLKAIEFRTINGTTIIIAATDFQRLKPPGCLNDTLIQFGLSLWLSEIHACDPMLADQFHVFSTFFFTALIQHGSEGVSKWTSTINIFTKRYLVVPIHRKSVSGGVGHWYLAIICNPSYMLHMGNQIPYHQTNFQFGSVEDNEPMELGGLTTTIYIFDSAGIPSYTTAHKLLGYLRSEARRYSLMPAEIFVSPNVINVLPNNYDCGIYLLHFAKTFMLSPKRYMNMINQQHSEQMRDHAQIDKDWNISAIAQLRFDLLLKLLQLSIGNTKSL